jgi:hypothetical protein
VNAVSSSLRAESMFSRTRRPERETAPTRTPRVAPASLRDVWRRIGCQSSRAGTGRHCDQADAGNNDGVCRVLGLARRAGPATPGSPRRPASDRPVLWVVPRRSVCRTISRMRSIAGIRHRPVGAADRSNQPDRADWVDSFVCVTPAPASGRDAGPRAEGPDETPSPIGEGLLRGVVRWRGCRARRGLTHRPERTNVPRRVVSGTRTTGPGPRSFIIGLDGVFRSTRRVAAPRLAADRG